MISAVALKTTCSTLLMTSEEEFPAFLFFFGESFLFSEGSIVFGVIAGDGEEEVFQSQPELVRGDGAGAVCFLKFLAIAFSPIKAVKDPVKIRGHFEMVLDGLQDLFSEAGRSAIPKEAVLPSEVEKGLRVSFSKAPFEATGEIDVIAEGEFYDVARGAGNSAIDREDGVVKEAISKGDALFRKKVIGGKIWFFKYGGLWKGELVGASRRGVLGRGGRQTRKETDHRKNHFSDHAIVIPQI